MGLDNLLASLISNEQKTLGIELAVFLYSNNNICPVRDRLKEIRMLGQVVIKLKRQFRILFKKCFTHSLILPSSTDKSCTARV